MGKIKPSCTIASLAEEEDSHATEQMDFVIVPLRSCSSSLFPLRVMYIIQQLGYSVLDNNKRSEKPHLHLRWHYLEIPGYMGLS